MNMAFFWLLLCISLLSAQVSQGKAFVTVECTPESVGHYGEPSVIKCAVKMSQEGEGSKIRNVIWMKGDKKLLVYDEGKLINKTGYKFAEPSWDEKNMNVSLLISSTVLADIGSYRCTVLTESGLAENSSNLSVTALYSKPNVTREKNALVCISKGGYPLGELNWYDKDGKPQDSKMEPKRDSSGLYTLTSKLNAPHDHGTYTCRVVSASEHKQETTFPTGDGDMSHQRTPDSDNTATRIVAPVVVIGSLIVGLLLVLVYKRHRTQARRPSAAPLMGFQPGETTYTAADQSAPEDKTPPPEHLC